MFDFVQRIGLPFVEIQLILILQFQEISFVNSETVGRKGTFFSKKHYETSKNIEDWKLTLDHVLRIFITDNLKISDQRIEIPFSSINTLPILGKLRVFQLLFQKEKNLWSEHDFKMLEQFLNKPTTGKISKLINSWLLLHDRGLIIAVKKNR